MDLMASLPCPSSFFFFVLFLCFERLRRRKGEGLRTAESDFRERASTALSFPVEGVHNGTSTSTASAMSHCEDSSGSGRHRAIFLTPEDADPLTSRERPPDDHPDDAPPGLITPEGDINWNCPCLGGMAVGPCGVEFRSAFECFHYSEAETKGSDCLDKFMTMQECMRQHPDLYEENDKEDGAAAALAAADGEGDQATVPQQQQAENPSSEKKAATSD